MNIKEKLSNASSYIIPILLIGLWIVGAFHGKKKHNIDPFSSNFFVCWYYGLETMWHKTDYSELNDNIKVVAYLIMQKPSGIEAKEQLEFNETKKDLKKVLEKLDTKELDYIKAGTKTFVDFMTLYQDDIIKAFLNYKTSKIFDLKFSDKTIKLSEKCSKYGLDKEMNNFKVEMEKIKTNLKEKLEGGAENFDESLIDEKKIKDVATQKINSMNSTVKEIFSE
jgi:hypothetical protein